MQRLTCHVLDKDLAISNQSPFSIPHSAIHRPETHTTHNVAHSPSLLHAEPSMWPLQLCLTDPGRWRCTGRVLPALTRLRPRLPSSLAQPYAVMVPSCNRLPRIREYTILCRRLYLPRYHHASVPPYHRIRTLLDPSPYHIASSHQSESLPYPFFDRPRCSLLLNLPCDPRCSLQLTPPLLHTSPGTQGSPRLPPSH